MKCTPYNIYPTNFIKTEGYPLMTRLQRRLYGIYTIYGLFFTIPLNCFFVLFYCFPIFFSLLNASFEEKIHTYSIHPFIYPSIYLSMYLSTIFSRKKTFLFFSTCLSIFLCTCLCLSFYLSMSIVYLSIYLGDSLHMHYTGTLQDGTEFDSSIPR